MLSSRCNISGGLILDTISDRKRVFSGRQINRGVEPGSILKAPSPSAISILPVTGIGLNHYARVTVPKARSRENAFSRPCSRFALCNAGAIDPCIRQNLNSFDDFVVRRTGFDFKREKVRVGQGQEIAENLHRQSRIDACNDRCFRDV